MKMSKVVNYIFGLIAGWALLFIQASYNMNDIKFFALGILLFIVANIVYWLNDEVKN